MSNLHRLQWIDAQIRAGAYPNARALAEAFEISRRQALRDFEYLRDSLGAPLEYSALHRGFTYSSAAFTLPGPYVTPAQQSLLGSLAAYYTNVAASDSRFGAAYADMAGLLQRLGGPSGAPAAGGGAPAASLLAPYRAMVELPAGALPPAIQPYWRGEAGPGAIACEFADPDGFLGALLGSGARFAIRWPAWLRARFLHRLDQLTELHASAVDVTRPVTPPAVSSGQQAEPRRNDPMKKSTGARFTPGWTSYVGAVRGVLTAAGMTDLSYPMLMGTTGMAFHLIMAEDCCVSSVTVYDWPFEHQSALDRLGVLSETFTAMPEDATYEAARRRAVTNIKAGVDRGVGAVLWGVDTGEFGAVYGYDDDDGVFLVSGCFGDHGMSQPILYENVGKTFEGAPMLHYQIPVERTAIDPARAYASSLRYYIRHTEATTHVAPRYKSGLLAYDNWVGALRSGKFQHLGLRYNTTVYAEAKGCAAAYLKQLTEDWNSRLAPAAEVFARQAAVYGKMMAALGHADFMHVDLHKPVADSEAAALLPLVKEARELEVEALAKVKAAL